MGLFVFNHVPCMLFIIGCTHTDRHIHMYAHAHETHIHTHAHVHTCTHTYAHTCPHTHSPLLTLSLSFLSQLQEPFLSAVYIIYLTLTAVSLFSVCKCNPTHHPLAHEPISSPYSNFKVVISLSPNYFIALYLLPVSYKIYIYHPSLALYKLP